LPFASRLKPRIFPNPAGIRISRLRGLPERGYYPPANQPDSNPYPMSVAIRLRREGAKNRPYYRIVVADTRSRREGPVVEQIGTYDPMIAGKNWEIDLEKAESWITKGAHPSNTVKNIINWARKGAKAEA